MNSNEEYRRLAEVQRYNAALQNWDEPTAVFRLGDEADSGPDGGAAGSADNTELADALGDLSPQMLGEICAARMPFGKYKDRLLIDLPEAYVLWFAHKGYPAGRLGRQLALLRVIKENGLEAILRPLSGA